VSVEIFSRDVWEALRQDLREQLGTQVSSKDFEDLVPTWDRLTPEARKEKIAAVRSDLLRPVLKAGYEIRRRA
jgi:hypothetical protein